MQNSSTGMLATNVPVGVVPSALRCPSWKIQTSAPNAAVNDNTLSTTALSGSTTLPVSRKINANVMTAIKPRTHGRRSVIACTLSWLTCATPANCTTRLSGVVTWCSLLSCASEASENNGAVLPTVRNALPSTIAAAAMGGPVLTPLTNAAVGVDTEDTPG